MERGQELKGKVALVTGGSRGLGKGVALALGDAGATVYITGRSVEEGQAPLPGTILATAQDVKERGGEGIALPCDHRDDDAVREAIAKIGEEQGRLDILVNNVFAVPDGPLFGVPFWEQPLHFWDDMHAVGLRSHYVASVFAVPLMLDQKAGLIVNISSFGGDSFQLNVAYGVGKAGVDRLAADMAHDLKPHGITAISLWPGIVRTERILEQIDELPFSLKHSESPEFTGRAVVALATDPDVNRHTGSVQVVAELAELYGFTDIDGSQPRSLRRRT